jgi:UDP-4-amino-4-deoxy-L-arabinose formyltransferase/UDP-glucuronic acid dehydrogenase (UDP-4-keto-hexauronic acid decarboxylating)
MRRLNVLLAAEEGAGLQALKLLMEGQHRLVAVLTSAPAANTKTASVAAAADRLGVPVRHAGLLASAHLAETLRREHVDLLINVHSLVVAHACVVAAPRVGSFNLHPGPLPEYAGLSAPSWAIYHGARRYGVSLHRMETGIDTGDIAFTAPVPISQQDTGLTLSAACVREGLPLIGALLRVAACDPHHIPAIAQDLTRRRYFGREGPHPRGMPWDLPARRLDAFVRASNYGPFPSPWGRPLSVLGDCRIEILKTALTGELCSPVPGTVDSDSGGTIRVATVDEWLRIERIAVDGRSAPPADVLREGVVLAAAEPTRV